MRQRRHFKGAVNGVRIERQDSRVMSGERQTHWIRVQIGGGQRWEETIGEVGASTTQKGPGGMVTTLKEIKVH